MCDEQRFCSVCGFASEYVRFVCDGDDSFGEFVGFADEGAGCLCAGEELVAGVGFYSFWFAGWVSGGGRVFVCWVLICGSLCLVVFFVLGRLCGSLTTFSSWNVNLAIFFVSDTSYAWAQVLFGFVIGIAMAMVSFTVGQHAGILLHRLNNSYHAREADLHVDSPQKYCHHRELPDFERHFLTDVYGEEFLQTLRRKHPNLIEELDSWKVSTSEYRHPYGPFRDTLREIEVAAFVENCGDISTRYGSLVNKVGWNLNSLQNYVSLKNQHAVKSDEADDESISIMLGVFACIFLILIFAFLLDGAASISTESESSRSLQNYHVFCLSGIFAPFGALGRWFLTRYNRGYLRGKYEWLPLGTLLTNLLGCIGSIIISSLLFSYNYDYESECILKALQTGCFGALSTVSTFANEISVLSKGFPSNVRGYVYAVGTISLTFTVSCIVYGLSTNSLSP